MHHDQPYSYVPIKTFVEGFQSFHIGRRLSNELATPFDNSKSHPNALMTTKYGASKKELLKACISREILLMKRNSFTYIIKTVQLIFLAFVTMTVFLRTEMHRDSLNDGVAFLGALYFTLLMVMFNGFAEIPMTVLKLPIFYKQRDFCFFPTWAYSLPAWILKVPISFAEAAIWVILTYYIIGFDPNVGRMFKQYVVLVLINQVASALFKLVASIEEVKKWWKWDYWFSPLTYAQNAVSVNEFLGKSWRHVLPGSSQPLGVLVLKGREIFTDAKWYWIGVWALVGYVFLFNALFPIALAYLNPFGKPHPPLTEEALKDKHANRTGDFIGQPNQEESSIISTMSESRGDEIRNNLSKGSISSQVEAVTEVNQNRKKGMVLSFQPISITFNDIKYSIDMPKEMKAQGFLENRLMLLKGVSGAFRPGVLTALMGASGAGKTTLMDVLAGRKTGGYVEGSITLSGYPKKQETFARISGYCEQNDIHTPHVTVYESLLFSAWLRLPTEIDSETREIFIEEIMELVELTSLKESLVGLPGINGLSTEQRKRLTIAVELVANPSILFMDEPTSGLDARAAAIVMRTVRNTVDTGRTVVCTIHQPSIDIFESFDELFLLKLGGEEIYVGPLGHNSCHMIQYFEAIQGVSKIKDGYNPATWMLEVTTLSREEALGVDFSEIYKNSDLFRRNKAFIEETSKPHPGSKDLYFPTQYAQSFFTQCAACLWKQNIAYWRNVEYTAVRLMFTIILSLMIGTMFWDLGSKLSKEQDLFNAMGSMYISILFLGMKYSSSVQPVVAVERTIFYRERAAGMYSSLPYAFGQVTIEIPYAFLQTLIYGFIVYAMIGFEWTVTKILWYIFIFYFTLLYFIFYGMMSVGLTPNQNIAAILSVTSFCLWNLFSGFLIPRPSIPVWWRWFYWTCPIAWTLYGVIISQYGDIQDELNVGLTVKEFLRSYFGFRHDFLGVISVVIVGYAVAFAFIFALSIKVFNFQKR